MSQQKFDRELNAIFSKVPPSDEFHIKLENLRLRMEKKYPALNNLPQPTTNVSDNILKVYTLAIVAVMYDKTCQQAPGSIVKPLCRNDIDKARTILLTLEQRLQIDQHHVVIPGKLSKSTLHMYGYLLMLITNYDYDNDLQDDYSCIMQMKFITELFRRHLATIDECPHELVHATFKNDDDMVRLYIQCKLAYADMLFDADLGLRKRLGVIASIDHINTIYSQHILARFLGTRHLTEQQIININLAIAELKSKVDAAEGMVLLSASPVSEKKRSFEEVCESTIHESVINSRYSFTAHININFNLTIRAETQVDDKKQKVRGKARQGII